MPDTNTLPAQETPTPDTTNPKFVSDLFAKLEMLADGLTYLGSKPGLLDQRIQDAINADVALIDDTIAAAIQADSVAKGSPIPEIVLRHYKDGTVGLYSFNAGAETGKHLVAVSPIPDFMIPLPAPSPDPVPSPAPVIPPTPAAS